LISTPNLRRPIAYYVIDFGLSQEYHDILPQNVTAVRRYGQDKTVPELSDTVPYNPFKVDIYMIYQLGNVIYESDRGNCDQNTKYEGLELFRELAEAMTMPDPRQRPTASGCLE
ncbi:hypothetical protein C8R44DRAFT_547735, partial [Mycena epipterygia]